MTLLSFIERASVEKRIALGTMAICSVSAVAALVVNGVAAFLSVLAGGAVSIASLHLTIRITGTLFQNSCLNVSESTLLSARKPGYSNYRILFLLFAKFLLIAVFLIFTAKAGVSCLIFALGGISSLPLFIFFAGAAGFLSHPGKLKNNSSDFTGNINTTGAVKNNCART